MSNEKNFSFIVLKHYMPIALASRSPVSSRSPFVLAVVSDTPTLGTNVRVAAEQLTAVGAVVLDLVGDAVAAERADEVLDVVLGVLDDFRRIDVVDVVSAVVAACVNRIHTLVAGYRVWQVPVVADVNHLVAVGASSLVCLRNHGAADAANQVLDVAFPLVAAC